MSEPAFDLSPAAIWQRSPLNLPAVQRVFSATGAEHSPVVGGLDLDSWELVLAIHAWEAASDIALRVNKATSEDCKAVSAALKKLQEAIDRLEFTNCQAPTVPEDFLAEITAWEQSIVASGQVKNARASAERSVLEPLLVVYEAVFGRPPSGSEQGPTARFVRAFLTEMQLVMQHAVWLEEPSSKSKAPMPRHLFAAPAAATLRSQIEKSKPDYETRIIINTYFGAVRRQLGGQPSGKETVTLNHGM